MRREGIQVVTGAFGFSGKYIAHLLVEQGHPVRTLTNSPERENPFEGKVVPFKFNFEEPEKLVESLRGSSVLYNNYWVRFNHSDFKYREAVTNTLILFDAAKKAGVEKIVHISITNPSLDSPFEYFRGKAQLEKALMDSGISYSILRPAVLFGKEDILLNNIAWFIRRFPLFGVFGKGDYRLQPIFVGDLAKLAVEEGQKDGNSRINAIGPETFTFRELIEQIKKALGTRSPVISIPPRLAYFTGYLTGKLLGDVTITKDEIDGLMSDLLYTDSPPVGKTRLTAWLMENSSILGIRYHNELARRKNRIASYKTL